MLDFFSLDYYILGDHSMAGYYFIDLYFVAA